MSPFSREPGLPVAYHQGLHANLYFYLCWLFYILFECGEKGFGRRVNHILHSCLIYINVLVFTIKMTKN